MNDPTKPFFVGYLPAPRGARRFLILTCAALIAGFGAIGFGIGATQADPGPGAFRFDYGRQVLTGVISARPYPVLTVTQGTERVQAGHTILLSGNGKNGVQMRADPLDGQLAVITGPMLERGALDMIQVRGGPQGLMAAEGASQEVPEEDLGRWRLAGEINDGKCLAGAMLPGRGLAHKACGNLCVLGGVPPVFVTSQPVEGSEFLLLGGPDGGPLPDALFDYAAIFISAEGRLKRRGDLLIFLIDPDTVEVVG